MGELMQSSPGTGREGVWCVARGWSSPSSCFCLFHFTFMVAVSRSTDVPFFGPPIPEGAVFDKNGNFRDFLLTKGKSFCRETESSCQLSSHFEFAADY